jgi:hypothetical protein
MFLPADSSVMADGAAIFAMKVGSLKLPLRAGRD